MAARSSSVLVIDDQSGTATRRHLEGWVDTIVRHPNDVTDSDLKRCKLVLVDFRLDEWPERDELRTPSLMPQTGIALIAVLRSNLARLKAAPTAFALNSGLLSDLSNGGTWEGREHAIAKSIDLEWVFAKTSDRAKFAQGVKSLAEAISALPTKWPTASKTKDQILKLLALPKSKWRQSAIEAIDRSYPPHEILIGNSSGIAIPRWLLHVILPYPTFLLDQRYLAARLSLEPSSLSELFEGPAGTKIRKLLSPCEYRGILSDFAGTRWWRAGLEYFLWEKTKGRPFDRDAIEKLVRAQFSTKAKFTELRDPVVSIDEQLRPCNALISLQSAIEVKPDGWPPFADGAWVSAALANDPTFVALVPQSEKNRLQ